MSAKDRIRKLIHAGVKINTSKASRSTLDAITADRQGSGQPHPQRKEALNEISSRELGSTMYQNMPHASLAEAQAAFRRKRGK